MTTPDTNAVEALLLFVEQLPDHDDADRYQESVEPRPEFNTSRKDTHWGQRKLKRDLR